MLRLTSARVAGAVITGTLVVLSVASCSSRYSADAETQDAPSRDAAASGDDAEGDATTKTPPPRPAAYDCTSQTLCVHFDGADATPVTTDKRIFKSGVAGAANGDAISQPAALQASAPSGSSGYLEWHPFGQFATGDVLAVRFAFQIASLSAQKPQGTIAFLGIGSAAQLTVDVSADSIDLVWRKDGTLVTLMHYMEWSVGNWDVLTFYVSASGVSRTAGGTILAPPPSGVVLTGSLGLQVGVVGYAADDATPISVLIDDVAVNVVH